MDTLDILLVEDNPGDVRLTWEALREGGIPTRLSVVRDGVEALDFLFRRGRYAEAPRPDLILLDLNLPRKDGCVVLTEVKLDATLRRIPIIVLTTSKSDQDVVRSYNLRANSYISKPVDMDRFIEVVRRIHEFWFGVATLPPK